MKSDERVSHPSISNDLGPKDAAPGDNVYGDIRLRQVAGEEWWRSCAFAFFPILLAFALFVVGFLIIFFAENRFPRPNDGMVPILRWIAGGIVGMLIGDYLGRAFVRLVKRVRRRGGRS